MDHKLVEKVVRSPPDLPPALALFQFYSSSTPPSPLSSLSRFFLLSSPRFLLIFSPVLHLFLMPGLLLPLTLFCLLHYHLFFSTRCFLSFSFFIFFSCCNSLFYCSTISSTLPLPTPFFLPSTLSLPPLPHSLSPPPTPPPPLFPSSYSSFAQFHL